MPMKYMVREITCTFLGEGWQHNSTCDMKEMKIAHERNKLYPARWDFARRSQHVYEIHMEIPPQDVLMASHMGMVSYYASSGHVTWKVMCVG